MGCLHEETMLGFVEGRLDTEELARVEAHTRACQLCDELLATAFSTAPAENHPACSVLPRGTRIGRYTTIDLVGVGGMSEVYAAYDPDLDRKIALKLMRPRIPENDARYQTHLVREARAIARLSHPNVVTVYDVGTLGARVFIAMEYVDGQTLSAWLAREPRSWRDILPIFAAAARGLGAAHAAGLVHRDFKPQNVMVGRDGVVRVMDFGLARRIDGGPPTMEGSSSPRGDWDTQLSRSSSEIVGTPFFMAPEQLRGEPADARSDQFSFSVALYDAIYGVHPFADPKAPHERQVAVLTGRLQPAPTGNAIPAWLRRVVVRGLSHRPEQRWPAMDDLVTALMVNAATTRRRRVIVFATLALAIAAAGLGRASRQGTPICQGNPNSLANAWSFPDDQQSTSDQRRAQVQAAFLGTHMPTAKATWERVSALLDRYAGAWLAMRRDACEATHVRGEQSAEVLDLRMACLDDRRDSLAALTNQLVKGDREAVSNAVDAVRALPTLDRCADVRSLRAAGKEPLTPAGKELATEFRRRAAAIKAIFDLGDQRVALERGKALIADLRAGGQQLLLAEMLNMVGTFECEMGFYADGAVVLRECGRLALSIHREDIAAEAYSHLAADLRTYHPEEALVWGDVAEALVDRAGRRQNILQSWILNDRAAARVELGDLDQGQRLFREALAIKRKTLAADDPDILITVINVAETLHRMGRNREALESIAGTCAGYEAVYGPGSALEANCLDSQGEILLALGKAAEALPILKRSLSDSETRDGPDNRLAAFALSGIGRALLMLHRPREARPALERAMAIRATDKEDPTMKRETQVALAQALWQTRDRARATRLGMTTKKDRRTTPVRARDKRKVESWVSGDAARRETIAE